MTLPCIRKSRMLCAMAVVFSAAHLRADELPGTKPLTESGDIAGKMVAGIDKYLMREIDKAAKRTVANPDRERLKKILGLIDQRISPVKMEYVGEGTPSSLVAETKAYKVYSVRWSVLPGI